MSQTRFILLCGFILFICCSLALVSGQRGITPRLCPRHETYTSCGPSCQTECATLNQPCLIRHIRCPDGCYCNAGYARNANGVCIPQSRCPK
ncbi:venom serine protease inhibitor [Rhagoletis pomonella]|uniref:venom serine protease inhibitor n=1 Tax=Rhagoletis pomonella TaxID=28610 RepID=UPI001786F824|nr:venom serine protease inhibitor [Rhagoletis pomonella]